MIKKVHREDSKIIMQIAHAGARASVELIKSQPLGPSSLEIKDYLNCREMTKKEIFQIIEDFKKAAMRAKKAGFDGIQIYVAHGFLLSQFLSPFFNKRNYDGVEIAAKNRKDRMILC